MRQETEQQPNLILAKTLETAFRKREKQNNPRIAATGNSCTGKTLFKDYFTYFRQVGETVCGFPALEFMRYFGIWLSDNGYNLHSKSVIRSVLGTRNGSDVIAKFIRSRKEVDERNKSIMGSILLSIRFLCLHTIRVGGESPSKVLLDMIKRGSVSRFIGTSLSNHFLAMVPHILDLFEKYSCTHYEQQAISGKFEKKKDPEYESFIRSFAIYRQEAREACVEYGFFGDVLDKTDAYFRNNRAELENDASKTNP